MDKKSSSSYSAHRKRVTDVLRKRGALQDLDLCFSHKIVSNYLHRNKVKQAYPKRKFTLAYSIKTCICLQGGYYLIGCLCKLEKGSPQSKKKTVQRTSLGQVFNSNPVCEIIILSNNSQHLLSTTFCSKHFTCINSCNSYNNSFDEIENLSNLPKVTQVVQ